MGSVCGWHRGLTRIEDNRQAIEYCKEAVAEDDKLASLVNFGSSSSVVVFAQNDNLYKFSDDKYDAVLYGLEGQKKTQQSRTKQEETLKNFIGEFQNVGVDAIKNINGAFTLTLLDKQTGETLIAVDRMGIHSMCYASTDDGILYGSSSSMFKYFPNSNLELNNQAIYNYLYFHVIPGPDTIYQNAKKIIPGGYLHIKDGILDSGQYWEIRYHQDSSKNKKILKDELFELFESSVREYTEEENLGAFLSGGIDSSTVVGFLSKTRNEPVDTFTIGFDEEGYDESYFANIAVKRYGANHHTYTVTPDDVLTAIPKIAARYDQPFGNSSAVPAYYCAKMAKAEGVTTLLAGDGGDELFGGNERYAKQYIFSLYDNIPGTIKSTLIEPLLRPISEDSKIFPLRKIKRYVEQANVPMPQRLETYNLLESFGIENVFETEFLSSVNTGNPREMQSIFYNSAKADGMLNRMLALDLKYAIADNDLPKVTQMCKEAGVDVAFPFLNDSIVEFSTKLPASYKVNRTKLRSFFKEALGGFLPDEIIRKPKHGFGQPFGVWINEHPALKALVFDSLNSLKNRGIVKSDFIDSLTNKYLAIHPHYYGNMVWILLMLEQWHQQHID